MSRVGHILDIEPELGADLEPAAFREARDLVTAPLIDVTSGSWTPGELEDDPAVRGRLFGLLVADGLSVREIVLADHRSTQLFGPGDLIVADLLSERSLPLRTQHETPGGLTVALLDDRFLAACRRWPRLIARLMDLATEQMSRTSVHQAISQLPRVEDRLLALFWLLADRWAQVSADGVVVKLPLTHEALGRLVGARRPTVSLGLRALSDQGTLSRREDGEWLLDIESLRVLESGGDEQVVRAVMSRRRPAAANARPVADNAPERAALLRRVAALRDEIRAGRAGQDSARSRELRRLVAEMRESAADDDASDASAVA